MPDPLRQLIEEVKLRVPIEDLVRDRVPELRPQGRLWTACCPFHEERTPSFKVDPARGTWRCYGACHDGGDVISFVERFDRLEFIEALELLASRAGLSLPARGRRREDSSERLAPQYRLLERAQSFFARELRSAAGARALADLRQRGFTDATLAAFGIGWAPSGGEGLVRRAAAEGLRAEDLIAVGLARRDAAGRAYDFFRERWTVPIRDSRGRTVGFGARTLGEVGPRNPKYVNTGQTALFHKGRLIFGLDRALEAVRRGRHLVLVEGYTDVMAAHQVGLGQCAAVLGTSFTPEHAALVRRTGARRVSLVFDGDAAGRAATARALEGLLPLGLEIDVVAPPEGRDPCDLCLGSGAAAFRAAFETARPWLEFLLDGLEGQSGAALAEGLDALLLLCRRLARPVTREESLERIAARLGRPLTAVREQLETLPERRRRREPVAAEEGGDREARPEIDTVKTWWNLAGAALLDASLLPALRGHVGECDDARIRRILEAALAVLDAGGTVGESSVMTELGGDPARELVGPLASFGLRAESVREQFEEGLENLRAARLVREQAVPRQALPQSGDDQERERHLRALHEKLRALKIPSASR